MTHISFPPSSLIAIYTVNTKESLINYVTKKFGDQIGNFTYFTDNSHGTKNEKYTLDTDYFYFYFFLLLYRRKRELSKEE